MPLATHVHVIESLVDALELLVVRDELVDPECASEVVYNQPLSSQTCMVSSRYPMQIPALVLPGALNHLEPFSAS